MSALRETARRLRKQTGRRGVILLWLAMVDLAYAFAFAFPTPASLASPVFRFFGGIFQIDLEAGFLIWAFIWGSVGLTCLFFAFRKNDEPAYIAAIVLKVFWAIAVLLAWVFVDLERGYLSAAIWGFFSIVLATHLNWQENPELDEGG